MKIECPHCNAQLRGKPELAGKRVSCPKCGEQVTIPAATKETPEDTAAPASSELWEVRTDDGTIYGPVEKSELDQWVHEDRLDEHCELRQGSQTWQPIGNTYEQFASTPQIETTPVVHEQPVQKQVVAKKDALAKEEVAEAGNLQAAQGTDVAVRPGQTTRYPMMLLASKIYKILGWIVMSVGGLGLLIYLGVSVVSAILAFQVNVWSGFAALGLALATVTVIAFYMAIMVISCWFISEAIGWMLDLQENSNKTNQLLVQLIERLSKKA